MATLAESFLADLEDLSDVEEDDAHPQQQQDEDDDQEVCVRATCVLRPKLSHVFSYSNIFSYSNTPFHSCRCWATTSTTSITTTWRRWRS